MPASENGLDTLRIVLMILLMIAFIGTWVWAWSGKRKKAFHEASLLPLEEDTGEVPMEPAKDTADKE